jgi:hypothetical protein
MSRWAKRSFLRFARKKIAQSPYGWVSEKTTGNKYPPEANSL